MKPQIIDLFCGAGLVHDGLVAAGFDVTGVDIEDQPRYPGRFIRADVFALGDVRGFDAVWASPPCLRETAMAAAPGAKGDEHPELIGPTIELLERWGLPYVIENVEATKRLPGSVILCGSMFELGVEDHGRRYHLERHRRFKTNFPLTAPPCSHRQPVVGCYGGHARVRAAAFGGRGTADKWTHGHNWTMAQAMGVDRPMTCAEISQGIPPIYAEWVGRQMMMEVIRLRKLADA